MPWLFLLIAIGSFLIAFTTHSPALLGISLLLGLLTSVAFFMSLLAQRMGSTTSSEALRLNPDELRRMREQADARRVQVQPAAAPAADEGAQSGQTLGGEQTLR